jgi:hypothetical protein
VIFDLFDDLNWAAVIVAAVAYFALGWLWYSNALFGRQYRAAIGKEEASDVVDVGAIVANLAGWFIAAVALALVSAAVGADSVLDGLVLGLVVSFGFIGTNRIVASFYETRNSALMAVNAPYTLLGYVIMGVILAVWT